MVLISTLHHNDSVNPKTGFSIMLDYNITKGGVDVVDNVCKL